MTNTAWLLNAVTGAPSYTGRMVRQAMSSLLGGASSARPLGARSGVRIGTPTTTVTATSTLWTVSPHSGVLDVETSAIAGPYLYAVDTAVTGAVTAADATNPRVDIVWVRVDDPAESDGSSVPALVPGYTAGTPAPIPAAPATPARCMVLATINVPQSGTVSPSVVWAAPYAAAAGGTIPVRSQAERDAITWQTAQNPVRVDRLDKGWIERSVASGTWTIETGGQQLARFRGTLGTAVAITGGVAMAFTVVEDTASGWATNVYTAPVTGTYLITGMIRNGVSGAAGQQIVIESPSGTQIATTPALDTAGFGGMQISKYLRLTVGTTLRMYAHTSYTTANDAPNNNWLEIVQVGF